MAGTKQQLAVQYVVHGLTYQQAADLVGLTRSAVAGACRRSGIKVGYRASSLEAIRAAHERLWSDPERRRQHAEYHRKLYRERRAAKRQERGHV